MLFPPNPRDASPKAKLQATCNQPTNQPTNQPASQPASQPPTHPPNHPPTAWPQLISSQLLLSVHQGEAFSSGASAAHEGKTFNGSQANAAAPEIGFWGTTTPRVCLSSYKPKVGEARWSSLSRIARRGGLQMGYGTPSQECLPFGLFFELQTVQPQTGHST